MRDRRRRVGLAIGPARRLATVCGRRAGENQQVLVPPTDPWSMHALWRPDQWVHRPMRTDDPHGDVTTRSLSVPQYHSSLHQRKAELASSHARMKCGDIADQLLDVLFDSHGILA